MAQTLDALQTAMAEPLHSSGSYMPFANRLLLMGLALSIAARDILETGTSSGGTTLALAMTGAHIVTVDHDTMHPEVTACAAHRLGDYANVECVKADALVYMLQQPDNSFDMLFVDDGHWPGYLARELPVAGRLVRPGGLLVFHDTLSCHMWEVLQDCLPASWQRINLPSWQQDGQDFGLGIVRKPLWCANPMEDYERLPSLPGHLPKVTYDMSIAQRANDGTMRRIGTENLESLVDRQIAMLETCRHGLSCATDDQRHAAQVILTGYGHYCGQRADEAMRRKFERVPREP